MQDRKPELLFVKTSVKNSTTALSHSQCKDKFSLKTKISLLKLAGKYMKKKNT